MYRLEHRGYSCVITFAEAVPQLDEQDRDTLAKNILDCYIDDKVELQTSGMEYEGKITSIGKYQLIGDLGGHLYSINFECTGHEGTQKASVLLGKLIDPRMN